MIIGITMKTRSSSAGPGAENPDAQPVRFKTHLWLALLLATAWSLSTAPEAADDGLAVIVSSDWTVATSIEKKVLKRIYLGKTKKFAGTTVHPINRARDSDVRSEFTAKVIKKSEAKLSEYWISQALDGGNQPPP